MHLDIYLILWYFWEIDRKRKRERALCLLGQNSCSAAGPEGKRPRRGSARARFSNLKGRARASARERAGVAVGGPRPRVFGRGGSAWAGSLARLGRSVRSGCAWLGRLAWPAGWAASALAGPVGLAGAWVYFFFYIFFFELERERIKYIYFI